MGTPQTPSPTHSIADLTTGQALVLDNAALLAQVIMRTAREGSALTRLHREVNLRWRPLDEVRVGVGDGVRAGLGLGLGMRWGCGVG